MFLVTCQPPVCVSILLTIVAACLRICSSQVKTSDACHGIPDFSQTYNTLECDESTQICITQVRYYLWDPNDQDCPRQVSSPVSDRCCRRKPGRCSWIRNATNHRENLQRTCTGESQCDLHSSHSEIIGAPCLQFAEISRFSSVRSITYTCSSSGTCPPPTKDTTITEGITKSSAGDTSATIPDKAETSTKTSAASTKRPSTEDLTPVIVGCVIAFIALVAIIIIIILIFVRKRFKRPKTSGHPISGEDSVPNMTPEQESSPAYYNIPLHDQQNQAYRKTGRVVPIPSPNVDNSGLPNTPAPKLDITGVSIATTLNLGITGVSIAVDPNLDTPGYYNVADETLSPTYYTAALEEDNAYIEMFENPYNKLTYTENVQEANYTALS